MPDNPVDKYVALVDALGKARDDLRESGRQDAQLYRVLNIHHDLIMALENLFAELVGLWNECQRAHLYLDLPPDVERALDVLNCKAKEVLK